MRYIKFVLVSHNIIFTVVPFVYGQMGIHI